MSKLCTTFLAGIALGILIAPDKGSNTRKRLSHRAKTIRDGFQRNHSGNTPMPPLARDSGLSTQISPEITGIS